jgi:hypothetical protein
MATTTSTSTRPLMMPHRAFTAFVGEVAAVCDRYGIGAHFDRDTSRLEQALWGFVHPDLVGTAADPYQPATDAEEATQ